MNQFSRAAFTATLAIAATVPVSSAPLTLVKDGRPAASIVIAERPTVVARFAADELQTHLRPITGAGVPIVDDAAPVGGVRILVGESKATRKINLRSDSFRPQEYLIQFSPNTLVLMGKDGTGEAPTNVSVHGTLKRVPGKYGGAFEFGGSSAISVAQCPFSDDSGCMEAWVQMLPTTQDAPGTILRLDGNNPWTYQIIQRVPKSNRVSYVTYDGKQGYTVTSGELSDGWHHLFATYQASEGQAELFVDGVKVGATKYVATTCEGANLRIGGIPRDDQTSNPFVGLIDGVRISGTVKSVAESGFNKSPETTVDSIVLLQCDEREGLPADTSGSVPRVVPPDIWEDQGTSYAVYDFLERFCGVRWLNPTDYGTIIPETKTLTVAGKTVRRSPAFALRYGSMCYRIDDHDVSIQTYWPKDSAEFKAYDAAAYAQLNEQHPQPSQYMVAKRDRIQRFLRRMRVGGERNLCNHSFYGYYDRFWREGSKQFEQKRLEFFAKGYEGAEPPQLCYTSKALVQQVAQDARDYYDRKKTGAQLGIFWDPRLPNLFPVEPMDNAQFCKCDECAKWINKNDEESIFFSNGRDSDYFFNFINEVAKELKKTHPDKGIITLAYHTHTAPPTRVKLAPSVAVQYCFACNRLVYDRPSYERELEYLKEWGKESKKRRMYLWLYYTFPYEVSVGGRFHCFPGYFAHAIGEQFKLFHKYGYRGFFHCGYGQEVEAYITYKLMVDPTLDVDQLLDEYFGNLYGAAATPMKQIYLEIEKTYCDPQSYPPNIASGRLETHHHQTEDLAWGWLGTPERMERWGGLLEQAKASARTDRERKCIELFEKGTWSYMVEGQQKYVIRKALKAEPVPKAQAPRVDPAGGDHNKVDWGRAGVLGRWRGIAGDATQRHIDARIAHDGEFLYLRLSEKGDLASPGSSPLIYDADDWEVFIAGQNGGPAYRQISTNPEGKWQALKYESLRNGKPWKVDAKVISKVTDERDEWTAWFVLPLSHVTDSGATSGSTLYVNVFRGNRADPLAWSPTFEASFHVLERLGEVRLE